MTDPENDGHDDERDHEEADESTAEPDDADRGSEAAGGISWLRLTFAAFGVLLTVAFVSFALWQALAAPSVSAPEATVVGTQTAENGDVLTTVQLRNPTDRGMASVTVESGCTDPPTELTFENVPPGGRRMGTMVCPPGTVNPTVAVSTWRSP